MKTLANLRALCARNTWIRKKSTTASVTDPSSLSAIIVQSALLKTRKYPRPIPSLFFFPGISNASPIIYDHSTPTTSPITKPYSSIANMLESNYDTILAEYKSLRATRESDYRLHKDEHTLHKGQWNWNSYILKGQRQADFASACPRTVEILESIPSMMAQLPFSYAFFSTLAGNSKIDPHFGPCNLRIRCHFPLIIPSQADGKKADDCAMEVGGQIVQWKKGKAVFFDDCYEHSVWNNTNDERVVLLFDIWHPDLQPDEISAITEMFSFAKNQGWGKKNMK